MASKWQEFLEERKYFKNVSENTLDYYRVAYRAWHRWLPEDPQQITEPFFLKRLVIELQKTGISAVSTNTYICALNTYLKWLGAGLKVPYLIEPQTVPRTFTPDQVQKLLELRPHGRAAHGVALTLAIIADTGTRAEEMLKLESHDIDLDGCILRVQVGKGRKGRMVPFSIPWGFRGKMNAIPG